MWENIRKTILCISFAAVIIGNLILIESGKYDTAAGITIIAVNTAYMFLFAIGNLHRN